MITSFFISIGSYLFSGLGSLLPTSEGLPTGVSDALIYVGEAINSISYLFPVTAIFGAVLIVATYQAAIWIFYGVLWVWSKIPIIGK